MDCEHYYQNMQICISRRCRRCISDSRDCVTEARPFAIDYWITAFIFTVQVSFGCSEATSVVSVVERFFLVFELIILGSTGTVGDSNFF